MNVDKLRMDFPLLQKKNPVVYFDTACMSLKPVQVINKIKEYYEQYPACAGRSMHQLSKKVEEEVAKSRKVVQQFVNAKKSEETIFTKNTTESLNLVAHGLTLQKGDVVLTSDKEHNSNLIPWQMLKEQGIKHEVFSTNADNTFNAENLKKKLTKQVKVVAFGHTSNLDGVSLPAKEIITMAHDNGSLVVLDAAQSVPHVAIDVRKLDADFVAFSGHKMLGPTGMGVLYGKFDQLQKLKPFITGGHTVRESTYADHTWEDIPHKFEAGLQDYAGIIGLQEAVNYLKPIREEIHDHEVQLNQYITQELSSQVKIVGPTDAKLRGSIFSFTSKMDVHEIALMLDQQSICVRSGAHCVHSWFNARKIPGSLRASLYFYNTKEEAEQFVQATANILKLK